VERRLTKLPFVAPLAIADLDDDECAARGEGVCTDYIQGVRLNDVVEIFLDAWGFPGKDARRYTFTIFERNNRRWCQVQGHIEDINPTIAIAVRTLAERT
jgi:hypothetical protein